MPNLSTETRSQVGDEPWSGFNGRARKVLPDALGRGVGRWASY